jgi:hypothetical protein
MPNPDLPAVEFAPRRRRGAGAVLLAAMLGMAVLGAGALVLSSDARLLRLGIVAALWAALVGAFAAARYRREVAADHDRSEELRRVYELELEREVAARREYELEVEARTRRCVEEEVRNEVRTELDGLRGELRTLRQNLEALLGGEVLVERVALRAESTRLRSLSDQARAARAALPQGLSQGLSHDLSQGPSRNPSPPPEPPKPRWPGTTDRTEIIPRYQERNAASNPETAWAALSAQPPQSQSQFQPQHREPVIEAKPEPPMADPVYASTTQQYNAWHPSEPQPPTNSPWHAEPETRSRRHSSDAEPAEPEYVGRRRKPAEDAGRSVDEILAAFNDPTPRRRHRRDGQ